MTDLNIRAGEWKRSCRKHDCSVLGFGTWPDGNNGGIEVSWFIYRWLTRRRALSSSGRELNEISQMMGLFFSL